MRRIGKNISHPPGLHRLTVRLRDSHYCFSGVGPRVGSGRMRYESPAVGGTGTSRGARSAHVVVIANEKGGSGKTTTAMHVVVALLKAGQKVASVDVDSRQRSLTRYVANRRLWTRKCGVPLELPDHHAVDRANGRNLDENEAAEFAAFAAAITAVEHSHDFVVIDTPATDSHLMRLAHAMADTLVTPLNDSFVDFDVLAHIDPESYEITETNHYADVVTEARRQRRIIEEAAADWIVVRNRVGQFETKNGRNLQEGLQSSRQAARLPAVRRILRARGLSRAVSARADGARYLEREHARAEAVARASGGAAGSARPDRRAAAADRRARPAARGGAGRMAAQFGPAARYRRIHRRVRLPAEGRLHNATSLPI